MQLMTTVTVEEASAKLKQLMELAIKGERVLITSVGGASVQLRPEVISGPESGVPRKPGLLQGRFSVGPEFFEPLPEEELEHWE